MIDPIKVKRLYQKNKIKKRRYIGQWNYLELLDNLQGSSKE
jgi:hypothetical protein